MASLMTSSVLPEVAEWYESKRSKRGGVNSNVMCVGLIIPEHMRGNFPLQEPDYTTDAGTAVKVDGKPIADILARYGETRPFVRMGGRTSRGSLRLAKELVDLLNSHLAINGFGLLGGAEQASVLSAIQSWFVDRVRIDYFEQKRIEVTVNPRRPARLVVSSIIATARERDGAAGAVVQHLVGALLHLLFPAAGIGREGYATADYQTGRAGDFLVGDTAVHVTMSPTEQLIAVRCKENIRRFLRPLVLVPRDKVEAARQLAEVAELDSEVEVLAIEDFIGLSLEQAAEFSTDGIRNKIHDLLEGYNERIETIERNPSWKLDIR
ncbi:DUF4928 family protein [Micromonospora chalcea]|uniref:DUF4928 family protein n=1 Tax=Micromonospora chalcea TaxID=1874 RepID=UPI003CED2955